MITTLTMPDGSNALVTLINTGLKGDPGEPTDFTTQAHIVSTSNPHGVTKAQVGLDAVDNVSAADLRSRATHTGEQGIDTIIGLQTALDSKIGDDVIWKDMLAPVGGASVPSQSAPMAANFGPAHTPQRREYSFGLGDYVFIQPFHTNHDIVPGGEAYLHVHWSTSGTSTGLVRWELTTMRAKGHDQGNFGEPVVTFIEAPASGTAWRHMVSETDTPFIMTEPDELFIVTVRRVAPSSGNNPDLVFGLMVDLHYQADRNGTPQKAPDFYAP